MIVLTGTVNPAEFLKDWSTKICLLGNGGTQNSGFNLPEFKISCSIFAKQTWDSDVFITVAF